MAPEHSVDQRLAQLLRDEDPAVRDLLNEAILMARDPYVSAESLVNKLERKLPEQWVQHED